MSAPVKCPKCGADNRLDAKFCDECGASIASTQQGEAKPKKANFAGLFIIFIIIVAAWWVLFGSGDKKREEAPPMTNPHTSMGSTENPHAMGNGMDEITSTIEAAKEALTIDPLDTHALSSLYQTYGMVGKQANVRPYLEGALTALEEKALELGEALPDTGMEIGVAAVLGEDYEGGRMVFEKLHELDPEYSPVVRMLGDINYGLENFDVAIDNYTEYINVLDVEEAADYWQVYTNRAASRLEIYKNDPALNALEIKIAIAELTEVTDKEPELFEGWLNYGHALNLDGLTDEAEAAMGQAMELAADEFQTWMVEKSLAELRGEEPPPPPMGNMGGSMMNPHG